MAHARFVEDAIFGSAATAAAITTLIIMHFESYLTIPVAGSTRPQAHLRDLRLSPFQNHACSSSVAQLATGLRACSRMLRATVFLRHGALRITHHPALASLLAGTRQQQQKQQWDGQLPRGLLGVASLCGFYALSSLSSQQHDVARCDVAGAGAVTTPDASPAPTEMRESLLREPFVFGTFASFRVGSGASCAGDLETLVHEANEAGVAIDFYLSKGLTAAAPDGGMTSPPDFFLRLHSKDLSKIQEFLHHFSNTRVGSRSELLHTMTGITKGIQYITKEQSPELNASLFKQGYADSNGPPIYVIVIPVEKSNEWWTDFAHDERRAMIEKHTAVTLPWLVNVKRKLYHSTGLSDATFLTFFETNDLVAFHELMVTLAQVPENRHHIRRGRPILLSTKVTPQALDRMF